MRSCDICSNKTGKHVQLQHSLEWNWQTHLFLLQKKAVEDCKQSLLCISRVQRDPKTWAPVISLPGQSIDQTRLISWSNTLSSTSAWSRNWHFAARFFILEIQSSTGLSGSCRIPCSVYLWIWWLVFSSNWFSNFSKITAGFSLSSSFANVQLLYISSPFSPNQRRI